MESITLVPASPAPLLTFTRSLFDEWLAGKRPSTLRAYAGDLGDFAAFIGTTAAAAVDLFVSLSKPEGMRVAMSYRDDMLARGLAAATVNRRLAALRSIVALANDTGRCEWRLTVKNVKAQAYRDTRGPGLVGFLALLQVAGGRSDVKALRDRAVLRLLFDAALRREEVASLDLEHVDFAAGTAQVLRKGKSAREARTLAPETLESIRVWVEARGREPGPLFFNLTRDQSRRGRLSADGVYEIVRTLGAKLGQRITPHGLRHAAITHALEVTNGNVLAVAKFSGHAKIETVRVYDDNRRDVAGDVTRLVAASAR